MKKLFIPFFFLNILLNVFSQEDEKVKFYDLVDFSADPLSVKALIIRGDIERLSNYPPEYYRKFINVKKITVFTDKVHLPLKLSWFSNLEELSFNYTGQIKGYYNVGTLYEDLSSLSNFKNLKISGELVNIGAHSIYGLKNLNSLSVSFRTWSDSDTIFNVIGNIKSLVRFEVGVPKNFRDAFPTGFCYLKNIKELRFYGDYYGSDFPDEIYMLTQLEILDLTESGMSSLSNEIGNLKNLKELRLKGCEIQKLPKNISKLKNLEVLTGIYEFPEDIGNLSNLETLGVSGHFKTIPPGIANLKKLKSFGRYPISIDSLPKEIGGLESLEELVINGTGQLSYIPEELCKLGNLKKLIIVGTSINRIPSNIGDLKNLEYLQLGNNKLVSIPTSISKLEKLINLDISGNRLDNIPITLFNLKNIRILNLGNNHISIIPPEIKKLNHLETIYLWGNRISQLPMEIGDLDTLQFLLLDNNQISKLPLEIGSLKSLIRLSLTNNPIMKFPKEIGNLKKLKILSASSNNGACGTDFYQINSNHAKSKDIKELVIPEEFGSLLNLEVLSLDCIDLKKEPTPLGNLENLRTLTLGCISKDLVPNLQHLPNLKVIKLIPNNFDREDRTELQKKFPNTNFIFDEVVIY